MRHGFLAIPFVLLAACSDSLVDPGRASAGLTSHSAQARLVSTTGFQIVELGDLGGPHSRAIAINDRGEIVGMTSGPGGDMDMRAFLWRDGEMSEIMRPGSPAGDVFPVGINGSGTVAGNVSDGLNGYAFSLDAGSMSVFPNVEVGGYGQAYAINGGGIIVGSMTNAARNQVGAVAWLNGVPALLPLPSGRTWGTARGINDHGWIVGETWSSDPSPHITLWRGSEVLDLGLVGEGAAINNQGTVAGSLMGPPFTWTAGQFGFLETFNGSAAVRGINDAGVVVGEAFTQDSKRRPVMWGSDGRIVDLGTLPGHTEGAAAAINNDGWVVGYSGGNFPDYPRAVIWLPAVPPDDDADDDGVPDAQDNCPSMANADQGDLDDDGSGDACDTPDAPSLFTAIASRLAGLDQHVARPLSATLETARKQHEAGRNAPAAGALGAFQNQVRAAVRRGAIAPADAARLLAQTDAILALFR